MGVFIAQKGRGKCPSVGFSTVFGHVIAGEERFSVEFREGRLYRVAGPLLHFQGRWSSWEGTISHLSSYLCYILRAKYFMLCT